MSKVKIYEGESQTMVVVHCPGCGLGHPFRTRGDGPKWTWNGDMEAPTFSPSMLVNKDYPKSRCHSFVENGKIRFLGDCHHDLKNTTVDLPDLNADGDPA